jgi:hypothetical protein
MQSVPKEGKAMLFAADGCVKPNIRTHNYDVTLAGNCEHATIIQATIRVKATDAHLARRFVERWLKLPQTHVTKVEMAREPTRKPD